MPALYHPTLPPPHNTTWIPDGPDAEASIRVHAVAGWLPVPEDETEPTPGLAPQPVRFAPVDTDGRVIGDPVAPAPLDPTLAAAQAEREANAPAEFAAQQRARFEAMTVEELRDECAARGLTKSGTKDELVDRLTADLAPAGDTTIENEE